MVARNTSPDAKAPAADAKITPAQVSRLLFPEAAPPPHPSFWTRQMQAGKLRHVRAGKRLFTTRAWVEEFLSSANPRQSAAREQKVRADAERAMRELDEAGIR